jgi:hypothetical protein
MTTSYIVTYADNTTHTVSDLTKITDPIINIIWHIPIESPPELPQIEYRKSNDFQDPIRDACITLKDKDLEEKYIKSRILYK